jgi:polysaccharide export outer membrane protein
MFRLFGCALLLACILVPVAANGRAQQDGRSLDAPLDAPKERATAEYRIGTGDVLQISVWGEAELTKTVTVRPDGKISLPLINEVQVTGLTSPDAQTLLNRNFSRYIRNPQASVIVSEIHSNVVYVTGKVRRPGAYPLAGGLAEHAKEKHVYVLRQSNGSRLDVNYKDAIEGRRGGHDVELLPGDTVVIP